jgi:predicted nucleic acid-binding protein
MLTDTGPLVALLDADDPQHEACVTVLASLPPRPLVTTWPMRLW